MKNWNEQEIEMAKSKGGVFVLSDPFDNLISTGIVPWPPAEIIQKLYQSRQVRAFIDSDLHVATRYLSYYSDIQSIHSEDAITWSVFGTVARSNPEIRHAWVSDLLFTIGLPRKKVESSEIFLWRRVPHPDTLVLGGPEIDFGILTNDTVVLGEAKWRSGVGTGQGKERGKDQIQLRVEFLQKYGNRIFPKAINLVVLYVGLTDNFEFSNLSSADVQVLTTTWDSVCDIPSHPLVIEVQKYLSWKKGLSKN